MKVNTNQATLLPQVAHARHGDPAESHLAAARVKRTHTEIVKERILACLITPAHDEEIIRRYRDYFPDDKVSDQGIRSRRSELSNPRWPEEPKVVKTGKRAITSHNRPTQVWRLA